MAVVVTVAKGYDLGYIWKTQGQASAERTPGGYYINAAQAGEPPGRWWGPGAQALGFTSGQVVERRALSTPSTSSATRGPGPSSAGRAAATRRSPITWPS